MHAGEISLRHALKITLHENLAVRPGQVGKHPGHATCKRINRRRFGDLDHRIPTEFDGQLRPGRSLAIKQQVFRHLKEPSPRMTDDVESVRQSQGPDEGLLYQIVRILCHNSPMPQIPK